MAWGALVFYCADGNWCCPNETNNDCCSTSSFWLAKGDPTIFGVVQSTGFSATASSGTSSLPAAASTTVPPAPGTGSDLVPSLVLETISTGPPTALPPHSAISMYTGSGDLLQGYCATPAYILLDGPTVYWAPAIGCVGDKTDCCPYSVAQTAATPTASTITIVSTVTVNVGPGGTTQPAYSGLEGFPVPASADQATLAHCPADYQTVSSGCCPS